jgi:uncharacterized membrane protein (DUF485 family)
MNCADYTSFPPTASAFGHYRRTLIRWPRMSDSHVHLTRVAAARWRLALLLTTAMTVIYVGFILLIAFNKPLLGTVLMPGLSLGILLGVLVIITAWALIVIYVRWTNTHYDHRVADERRSRQAAR